ncbi:hypothetical protein FRC07_012063, partial [Ceratobasidium sp. 392]
MLRRNTSATCGCGATQPQLGQHWLLSTETSPLTPVPTLNAPDNLTSSTVSQEPAALASSSAGNDMDNLVTNPLGINLNVSPVTPLTLPPESLPRLNQLIWQTRRPRPVADVVPVAPQPPINVGLDTDHEPGQEGQTDSPTQRRTLESDTLASIIQNIIFLFPNLTTFRLAHWFFTGSPNKSLLEQNRLVDSVILAPGFSIEHLGAQDLETFDKALDQLGDKGAEDLPGIHNGNNWIKEDVCISIPQSASRTRHDISTTRSETYSKFGHQICIPGYMRRNLVKVITARFTSPTTSSYSLQYVPYRKYWQPGNNLPEERIYNELYTLDAWLDEHAAVQRLPPVEGCTRKRAIAALMFSSDATHVGNAAVWPVYMTYGNISKYIRCKASNQLLEHVAYLVKL